MKTINCENCDSNNLTSIGDLYLTCQDCGRRHEIFREDIDNDYSKKKMKRSSASSLSWGDHISVAMNSSSPNELPLSLSERKAQLVLMGFQALLGKQAESLKYAFEIPKSKIKPSWFKPFRKVLGHLWLSYLKTWIKGGWGDPLRVNLADKRFGVYGENNEGVEFIRKVPLERRVANRRLQYTKKPRATSVFKYGKKIKKIKNNVKYGANLQVGDLNMDLSIAFLYLAVLVLNLPISLSEIIESVKKGWIPFYNAKEVLPTDLVDEMKSIQISNSHFLSDFFTSFRISRPKCYISYADQISQALGLNHLPIKTGEKWFHNKLLRIKRRLNLPVEVFEMSLKIANLWGGIHRRETNVSTDKYRSVFLTAIVIIAAKFLIRFDDSIASDPFGSLILDSSPLSNQKDFLKVEMICSRLPQPDKIDKYHGLVVDSMRENLFKTVGKGMRMKFRGDENRVQFDKQLRLSYKRAVMRKKNFVAENYNCYGVGEWVHRSYSQLISYAAEMSDSTPYKVQNAVKNLEAMILKLQKCLLKDKMPLPYRSNRAKLYYATAEKGRKDLQYKGRVTEKGRDYYIRVWVNSKGEELYDCTCGLFPPSKFRYNVRNHWVTMICLIDVNED